MNYRSCWSLIYSSLFFHIRNKNRYILDTIHLILSPSPNLNSAVIAFFFFLMISSFLHFPLKESVRFRQLSRWSRNHSSLKVERCWPLPWRRKKKTITLSRRIKPQEKKNTMKSRFKWYSIQKERGGAANKTRGIRYRARCMYVSCVRTPQHHPQLFFFFSFSLHSPMVFLFLFYPTVLHWEKNKNNQNKNRKILKFKKTMKVA